MPAIRQRYSHAIVAPERRPHTGRLAKFKLPKRVIFVSDLPRNTMGKVQKSVLREQNKGLYADLAQPARLR